MDKIYVVKMEQKIPSCMLCKKNPGKVTYLREYKSKELLIVCDKCLKEIKILGRDVKIEDTEEYKLQSHSEEYVEIPCPGCPDKTTKVLKTEYEKNKDLFDKDKQK